MGLILLIVRRLKKTGLSVFCHVGYENEVSVQVMLEKWTEGFAGDWWNEGS